jgi:hypothetical protein
VDGVDPSGGDWDSGRVSSGTTCGWARAFDTVLAGAEIRTPGSSTESDAIAERWVGTLRRECLDHIPITGPRHLKQVL